MTLTNFTFSNKSNARLSNLSGLFNNGFSVDNTAIYAANGFTPDFIASFENEEYFLNTNNSSFNSLFNYNSSSPRTMLDSDGLIKWAPMNLVLNSDSPVTQIITVAIGAQYTVHCQGAGDVVLTGAGMGTVVQGSPVTITATTHTLGLTVGGTVSRMWVYRSDLGGMVNVPPSDRVDNLLTYVPTTSSSVYFSRRNHYNSGQLSERGLLFEPESATNKVRRSTSLSSPPWSRTNTNLSASGLTSPDGNLNAWELTATATTGEHRIFQDITSSRYRSVWAKAGTAGFICLTSGTIASGYAVFDLNQGIVERSVGVITADIIPYPNGWYRCIILGGSLTRFLTINMGTTADNSLPQGRWLGAGETVHLYGPQASDQEISSYIPTFSATATRSSESLSVESSSSLYSAAGMSFSLSCELNYADRDLTQEQTLFDWRVDVNNRITVTLDTSGGNTGRVSLTVVNGGVSSSVSSVNEIVPGLRVISNIAWRVTPSGMNIALNGLSSTLFSLTGLPDLTAADIFTASQGVTKLQRVWSQDIGDTGIEEAST